GRIRGGVDMERIAARGQPGRLGIVCVPVVAAGLAVEVSEACDLGRLVPANTRLGCPEGKAAAAQVEVRHLLATTPDMLLRFCDGAQPEPVEPPVEAFEVEA